MSVIDIFIAWLSFALMLWFASRVLPGFEVTDGFQGAASSAVVLSILSAIAGYVLFNVFDMDNFIGRTRGMHTLLKWAVNTGLLFATERVCEPVTFENQGMAVLAAIVISVGSDLLEPILYSIMRYHF